MNKEKQAIIDMAKSIRELLEDYPLDTCPIPNCQTCARHAQVRARAKKAVNTAHKLGLVDWTLR